MLDNRATAAEVYASAVAARARDDLPSAERLAREGIALAPESPSLSVLLGEVLLAQGRYAEGWAYYDAWPRLAEAVGKITIPKLPWPMWRGEPLAGKSLLVHPTQGYGDQMMYARFIRQLGASKVTWVCNPALTTTLQGLGADVLELRSGVSLPICDYWSFPLSLPRWLGVTRETVPRDAYLPSHPVKTGGLNIGVCWQGNPDDPTDGLRSAPQSALQPLMDFGELVPLSPAQTGAQSFSETATIMDRCDLVVTVDTSVAHLAGAMGRPCWTMLPAHGADWRWGQAGREAPWYGSMTLFRQHAPGDWPRPWRISPPRSRGTCGDPGRSRVDARSPAGAEGSSWSVSRSVGIRSPLQPFVLTRVSSENRFPLFGTRSTASAPETRRP